MAQNITSASDMQRPVLREIKCPKCASPVQQLTPDVQTLVCKSCHSAINDGPDGLTWSAGSKLPTPRVPIRIGQILTIENVKYFVLGRVIYQGWDPEETSDRWTWNEWLLGSPDGRMIWLSLDEHGLVLFNRLRIREAFDVHRDMTIPVGPGKTARVVERYPARVMGVDGELTWRAKRGDLLTMIEGQGEGKLYSVQATDAELEFHEGRVLDQNTIKAMLGEEAAKEYAASRRSLGMEVGVMLLIFAVAGVLLAGIFWMMGRGTVLVDQQLSLQAGTPQPITVNFEYPNRPVLFNLELLTTMSENSFNDLEVSVVSPDETETVVSFPEFWHETGVDEGEFWREQQTSGEDAFVPFQSGQHTIELELDAASNLSSMDVKLQVRDRHLSAMPLLIFSAVAGAIGAIALFLGIKSRG
jgi:Domain of unknown function (DUF4178)